MPQRHYSTIQPPAQALSKNFCAWASLRLARRGRFAPKCAAILRQRSQARCGLSGRKVLTYVRLARCARSTVLLLLAALVAVVLTEGRRSYSITSTTILKTMVVWIVILIQIIRLRGVILVDIKRLELCRWSSPNWTVRWTYIDGKLDPHGRRVGSRPKGGGYPGYLGTLRKSCFIYALYRGTMT